MHLWRLLSKRETMGAAPTIAFAESPQIGRRVQEHSTGSISPYYQTPLGRVKIARDGVCDVDQKIQRGVQEKHSKHINFGPGTLWRTWGTRSVPVGFC